MLNKSDLNYLSKKRILITGGTGSLGNQLTSMIIDSIPDATIIILSRDEFKQFEMKARFTLEEQQRIRFFLGDVRDKDRLYRAFEGVDYVIHTAALKQVPAAEYNPFEFIKTNVMGAENIINAAIDNDVKNVVALSTDKAANPINLYGATKLCSDKLFVSGNNYSGLHPTQFAVVRYGNVVGSRGSVVPFFLKKRKTGDLPITHEEMTRFWITLEQGASLVLNALRDMKGGEIYVPRIPSMKIMELARVVGPECDRPVTGIRPGEKIHEVMISEDDARNTLEFEDHYIIQPAHKWWTQNEQYAEGIPCPEGFAYSSGSNDRWVSDEEMVEMIGSLDSPEAKQWLLAFRSEQKIAKNAKI